MKTFTKVDDNTMQREETITEIKKTSCDYSWLLEQKKGIIQQRDKELTEIEKLILEAEKLGLKERKIVGIL